MQKVLNRLLCTEREVPNVAMRKQLLQEQKNACNMCGSAFNEDMGWDHIVSLHSTCQGAE